MNLKGPALRAVLEVSPVALAQADIGVHMSSEAAAFGAGAAASAAAKDDSETNPKKRARRS